MTTDHHRLQDDLDAELDEVEASADPADDDEPERGPFETRLRSLHDAVTTVEDDLTGSSAQGASRRDASSSG